MSVQGSGSRESRVSVAVSYVVVVGFWLAVIAVTGFIGGVTQ